MESMLVYEGFFSKDGSCREESAIVQCEKPPRVDVPIADDLICLTQWDQV